MTKREQRDRRAIGAWATAGVLLVLWIILQFDLADWNWAGFRNWAITQALPVVVLLGAAVFAVVGTLVWLRPTVEKRTPGLSWWAVVAAAMVVAAIAWGATDWLLGEANGATDRGAARVDAIKTGLGIGAGTTGIFALLLAVRRQTHQEHTAADTSFDAAEKRVTELYTKAVEQLGSDHAAVRLGGLYALERLAQGNPEHRQTIVNVLCAYLRMHYDIPGDPPEPSADKEAREDYRKQVQEREVRLTAQRILHNHLLALKDTRRWELDSIDTYWEHDSIDLTGACLIDFDLAKCWVHAARFNGATFAGDAAFYDATFTGGVRFSNAIFTKSAWFDRATFTGDGTIPPGALFEQVTFAGDASFDGATFTASPENVRQRNSVSASFRSATFAGATRFQWVTFDDFCEFDEATFAGQTSFNGTTAMGRRAYMPSQLRPALPPEVAESS